MRREQKTKENTFFYCLSPEGKKQLLAPKRKKGAIWRIKPRRTARRFFIATPSARTAPKQTDPDIFEDLIRKHASTDTARKEFCTKVQSSTAVMHQQFFPTLQKDDAAKTSCNTNRREGRLSAYQGTESSEHLECVSMEFTCSSSLKLPEDTVTPMVLHALESKPASNINISRVRSFLDHLACGDKLSHAVQNSSLKMMPGLPLEQNLQSMLPHARY